MTFADWELEFKALVRELFQEFEEAMGRPDYQQKADWRGKFKQFLKERDND